MPATDPFDPEQLRLFQALGQALIQNAPEHFKSVFCRIEQAPGHGKRRLQYRIGSTEHPNEDTSQPARQFTRPPINFAGTGRKRGDLSPASN